MRVPIFLALFAALGLAGSASASVRLPTSDQVAAYVRDNWADYAPRIEGQAAPVALVAVRSVVCRDLAGTPDCAFQVTVRLADGRERDHALSSSFEWTPEGALEEVIVLRPRRRMS